MSLGDNKPSLPEVVTHFDNMKSVFSDWLEFAKAEGENVIKNWAAIETYFDGAITAANSQVDSAKAHYDNARTALQVLEALKETLKNNAAASAKSLGNLIGSKPL